MPLRTDPVGDETLRNGGNTPLRIIPKLSWDRRRRLRRLYRREKNGLVRVRILVIRRLAEGDSSVELERSGLCVRSTVSHVGTRFRYLGELGLEDGRRWNGRSKLNEAVLMRLSELISSHPQQFGWGRTTWTRELLVRQLKRDTGVRISLATLGASLRRMGARWGRPKLFVGCPWSRKLREKRLLQIRRLLERLPANEVALYEDEVDIHLNPRSGPDWMLPGVQKRVRTPGNNKKRFLAGALNMSSGTIVCVEGERKRSQLFIDLLAAVRKRYPRSKRIHLIVDNYSIHSSRVTRAAVEGYGGRIALHFLPPFSPDNNPIEGLWRDLHANVTRNHRCATIDELMKEVRRYLRAAQPYPGAKPSLRRAA